MKRILLLLTILFLSKAVTAQIATGIGTPAPDYTLDINGLLGINDTLYHNDDSDTWMAFVAPDTWELTIGGKKAAQVDAINSTLIVNSNNDDIDFLIRSDGINALLYADTQNDHIGIGNPNPEHLVDIDNGNMLIRSDGINALMFTDYNSSEIGIGTDGPEHLLDIDNGNVRVKGNSIDNLLFVDHLDNKIGIGTDNPQATLHVEGATLADSLQIGNSMSIKNMQFGQEIRSLSGTVVIAIGIDYTGFTDNPKILVSASSPTPIIEPMGYNVGSVSPTGAIIFIKALGNPIDGDIIVNWIAFE